ncbi:MAG: sarcosine oxidase subunit delta [Pseudomonadota bacterium]
MLLLTCPNCGLAVEETELSPGGEAHLTRRGPEASDDAFEEYLFLRDNAKGVVFERWRHAYGCGKWFLAARHSVTMEVFGTYPAQTTAPPEDLMARIRERTET